MELISQFDAENEDLIQCIYKVYVQGIALYEGHAKSLEMMSDGHIRIQQFDNGQLFAGYDFYGEDGKVRVIRISGQMAYPNYVMQQTTMKIFGLKLERLTNHGDYVECVIAANPY